MKKKFYKKNILITSSLLTLAVIPASVISCSKSSNDNQNLTQELIDKQFEIFSQSLIKNDVQNNLYFENFDFDPTTNQTKEDLNSDEINKIISFPKLDDSFIYSFEVKKISNENAIEITMKMQLKNSKDQKFLLPSNSKLSTIKISNVRTLDSTQSQQLANIYQQWKTNGLSALKIINETTKQQLNQIDFKNCLPSYLKLNNINMSINFDSFLNNVDLSNLKTDFEFDDIEGNIKMNLNVINPSNGLIFYSNNYDDDYQIIVDGFITQPERDEQVTNIYSTLSQTFNLSEILDKKQIPFLSSGVTTIDQVKQAYQDMIAIKANEKISNILDLLNNQTWFNLSISTSANDVYGTLTIDWTISDKFTGYQIRPQNISKTTTWNNMLKLTTSEQNSEGKDITNYDIISNGYEAYQLLDKLKFKNKYSIKSSEIQISQLSNQWLLDNTNILNIIGGISSNGDYLQFSITNNNNVTSNFRFKIDTTQIQKTITNNVNGILEIPFVMQIEIEVNSTLTYVDFLPPNGIVGAGENQSYNSAAREAYIQIGDFLNENISNASIIYDYLAANSNFEIDITENSLFENIRNECFENEAKIPELLETQIKQKIINNVDPSNKEIVSDLLNIYSLSFDLYQNEFINYDENQKQFSTNNPAEVKLISNGNNLQEIEIPYYKNGVETPFPKITIIVKNIS